MYSTIVVVIVGVVCLLVGLLIGLWFGKSGQSAEAEKTEAVKTEFSDYRDAVNQHFENSAKHFAAIGQEYQALYRHMANGADALLADDSDVRRTGFPVLPAASDIAADIVEDDQSSPTDNASPDVLTEPVADASNDEDAAAPTEEALSETPLDEEALAHPDVDDVAGTEIEDAPDAGRDGSPDAEKDTGDDSTDDSDDERRDDQR
ncbi:MAG: DUF1043 family protein [Pseudomonadota bacterium]